MATLHRPAKRHGPLRQIGLIPIKLKLSPAAEAEVDIPDLEVAVVLIRQLQILQLLLQVRLLV